MLSGICYHIFFNGGTPNIFNFKITQVQLWSFTYVLHATQTSLRVPLNKTVNKVFYLMQKCLFKITLAFKKARKISS